MEYNKKMIKLHRKYLCDLTKSEKVKRQLFKGKCMENIVSRLIRVCQVISRDPEIDSRTFEIYRMIVTSTVQEIIDQDFRRCLGPYSSLHLDYDIKEGELIEVTFRFTFPVKDFKFDTKGIRVKFPIGNCYLSYLNELENDVLYNRCKQLVSNTINKNEYKRRYDLIIKINDLIREIRNFINSDEGFKCPYCSYTDKSDINAAYNIMKKYSSTKKVV